MGKRKKIVHDYSILTFWGIYAFCIIMLKKCYIAWISSMGHVHSIAVYYVPAVFLALLMALYGYKRNFENTVKAALVPAAIYTFWGLPVGIIIIAVVAVFSAVLEIFDYGTNVRSRVRNWINTVTVMIVFMFAGSLAGNIGYETIINVKAALFLPLTDAEIEKIYNEDVDMNELILRIDNFDKASDEEKLSIIYAICAREKKVMGLQSTIKVEIKDLSSEGSSNTLGQTLYSERTIEISPKSLTNKENMVHVVLHEMYHVQQHELVEVNVNSSLGYFDRINTYREEFANYKDCRNGYSYEEYANQALEIDAELYAALHIRDYVPGMKK